VDEVARALADGIEAAIPVWVERCVDRVLAAWSGQGAPPAGDATPEAGLAGPADLAGARRAAAEAGRRAGAEVGRAVRALLEVDIDEQRTTPLAIVRQAVRYPTAVLREAGVPPVRRDAFAVEAFPADDYDLSPASLADLDPALRDAGIVWGAAKAFEHRRRHGGGSPGATAVR
jgi:hypothetical protein